MQEELFMSEYFEWDGFSNVYLEDSFVLQISESRTEFIFDIEIVLTEEHPLFEQPKADERYCYHNGKLLFSGISAVNWKRKSAVSSYDANGEVDYGNIDVLRKVGEELYQVSGDWGDLEITSTHIEIIFR